MKNSLKYERVKVEKDFRFTGIFKTSLPLPTLTYNCPPAIGQILQIMILRVCCSLSHNDPLLGLSNSNNTQFHHFHVTEHCKRISRLCWDNEVLIFDILTRAVDLLKNFATDRE